MALVLGLKNRRAFYLNDARCTVVAIRVDPVEVDFELGGEEFTLTKDNFAELPGNVTVSLGYPNTLHLVKVLIDADRSIKVLRDNLYEEENHGKGNN